MKIIIDGMECQVEKGEYLLDIARRNGIDIPTLCHSDALPGLGSCRLCIVEVIDRGRSKVVTSCIYPVEGEIEVLTHSEKIINMRKTLIKLLAARTPENPYIKKLMKDYSVKAATRFKVDIKENCILCGLCVRACEELGSNAISTINRGVTKKVSTPYDEPSKECIGCGSCAYVCPTEAIKIHEENGERQIWGKTFKLIKCLKCGEYFITEEQIDYLKNKLQIEEYEHICDKCKRRGNTEKLKDIYKNIK